MICFICKREIDEGKTDEYVLLKVPDGQRLPVHVCHRGIVEECDSQLEVGEYV